MAGVRRRRLVRALVALGVLLVATVGAIAFALRVTPAQSVSTLGQTVEVGTVAPSLSFSGPGQLDLFGQSLDTKVQFAGPVRPRLTLTKISVNRQVAEFLQPGNRGTSEHALGQALASGWKRYFAWEIAFVAIGALVLLAAAAGILRLPRRQALALLGAGLVLAEGVNLGAIMLTAYSAPAKLSRVGSLAELVGRTESPPVPTAPGGDEPGVQAVVLGDSTAAGLGNPPLASPTPLDQACHRSSASYAAALAQVNGWHVENLACSGATIPVGILGPQALGSVTAPAQLAVAKRAVKAKALFLSVGADDLSWSTIIRLCALGPTCDDAASTAYFQGLLHQFTGDYYDLLRQLAAFPGKPTVVVNLYYAPFNPRSHCLDAVGLTGAKQEVLLQRLQALNAVLRQGAVTFGARSAKPDFSGHQLCSAMPYVQGLSDPAPFHPTASGELAIALADERALGIYP